VVARANRLKDEFLATLSHELRTPLNAILGWSDLLVVHPDTPASLQPGLSTISRNARIQSHIVNDLLDVSRFVTGSFRLTISAVQYGGAPPVFYRDSTAGHLRPAWGAGAGSLDGRMQSCAAAQPASW